VPVRRQPLAEVPGQRQLGNFWPGPCCGVRTAWNRGIGPKPCLPRSWLLAVGGAPTLSILSLMLLSLVRGRCGSTWYASLALGFAARSTRCPSAGLPSCLGPVIDLKRSACFGVLRAARHPVTAAEQVWCCAVDWPMGESDPCYLIRQQAPQAALLGPRLVRNIPVVTAIGYESDQSRPACRSPSFIGA